MMLKAAFVRAGIELYIDSPTNQQFVLLNDAAIEHLKGKFIWEDCGKHSDGRTIARFCTAWSTTDEALQALLDALGEMEMCIRDRCRRYARGCHPSGGSP